MRRLIGHRTDHVAGAANPHRAILPVFATISSAPIVPLPRDPKRCARFEPRGHSPWLAAHKLSGVDSDPSQRFLRSKCPHRAIGPAARARWSSCATNTSPVDHERVRIAARRRYARRGRAMTAPQNIIAIVFDFDDTLTDDSTTALLKTALTSIRWTSGRRRPPT